jgi:hypothetical protein
MAQKFKNAIIVDFNGCEEAVSRVYKINKEHESGNFQTT